MGKDEGFLSRVLDFFILNFEEERKTGLISMLVGVSDPILKSIEGANSSSELDPMINRNSNFNTGIAEILRCNLSLHSLVSLIKPEKKIGQRRLHFMLHKIFNRENLTDKFSLKI